MGITIMSSATSKQDSLMSETDSIGAATTIRTSSIRWKEPSFSIEEEPPFLHEPIFKASFNKPSSLKSASADSRTKLLKSRGSISSGENVQCGLGLGLGLGFYKSPSTPSSISSEGRVGITTTIRMSGNVSISLEDVALPGDSGSGIGTIRRRDIHAESRTPKTWSFDDLSVIKKQLSMPPSPTDHDRISLMYSQSPRNSVIMPSPRHHSVIDNLKLYTMTKEDIVSLWRSSERELLNNLQDALQQKRALEERVATLQRMLTKPP